MASVKKYNRHDAINILRHNERSVRHSRNKDIDRERTHLNYNLVERDVSAREYYCQRLSEVHCLNRADVNTLCCWIVTAPKNLREEQLESFFCTATEFIAERYGGEQNLVSAWVHMDEVTPHVHVSFLPVVYDEAHDYEKICANDVITRMDLKTFHPDLQKCLYEHGIDAKVYTGVTREQGGNRTVAELKRERELQLEQERQRDFDMSDGWGEW